MANTLHCPMISSTDQNFFNTLGMAVMECLINYCDHIFYTIKRKDIKNITNSDILGMNKYFYYMETLEHQNKDLFNIFYNILVLHSFNTNYDYYINGKVKKNTLSELKVKVNKKNMLSDLKSTVKLQEGGSRSGLITIFLNLAILLLVSTNISAFSKGKTSNFVSQILDAKYNDRIALSSLNWGGTCGINSIVGSVSSYQLYKYYDQLSAFYRQKDVNAEESFMIYGIAVNQTFFIRGNNYAMTKQVEKIEPQAAVQEGLPNVFVGNMNTVVELGGFHSFELRILNDDKLHYNEKIISPTLTSSDRAKWRFKQIVPIGTNYSQIDEDVKIARSFWEAGDEEYPLSLDYIYIESVDAIRRYMRDLALLYPDTENNIIIAKISIAARFSISDTDTMAAGHLFNVLYNRRHGSLALMDRNFQFEADVSQFPNSWAIDKEKKTSFIFYESGFFDMNQKQDLNYRAVQVDNILKEWFNAYSFDVTKPVPFKIAIDSEESYDGINHFDTSKDALTKTRQFFAVKQIMTEKKKTRSDEIF